MALSDTLIINRKLGGKLFLFYTPIDAYYHYLFPGHLEGLKLFKLNDITASTLYDLIAVEAYSSGHSRCDNGYKMWITVLRPRVTAFALSFFLGKIS